MRQTTLLRVKNHSLDAVFAAPSVITPVPGAVPGQEHRLLGSLINSLRGFGNFSMPFVFYHVQPRMNTSPG